MPKIMRHPNPKFQRFRKVRESFAVGLSRICYLLALGHFVCVPILVIYGKKGGQSIQAYQYTVCLVGVLLTLVGYLSRYRKLRRWLPQFCFGLLYLQVVYLSFVSGSVMDPIAMLLPLMTSFATPVLGKSRSYVVGFLSTLAISYLWLGWTPVAERWHHANLLPFILLQVLVIFSALLSEFLWKELMSRDMALKSALLELEKRNWEMENWVQRLGRAGSQINAGNYSVTIPDGRSDSVFSELTQSMELMQQKLNQYFTDLLLKDRLSSLGILASGIAHELNTPLTTIQFIIHSEKNLSEDSKALLNSELERMGKITRDLLCFARPTTHESFDLNQIIGQMRPMFSADPHSHAKIIYELYNGAVPIEGMANQFQQILINLVHNSIDAVEHKSDGQILIRSEINNDGIVTLSVTDNGTGIPKENIQKILDPFFTTKDPGRGTGLGLFIVHQIIQSYNGELNIQSEPGMGTTVSIRLCAGRSMKREVA